MRQLAANDPVSYTELTTDILGQRSLSRNVHCCAFGIMCLALVLVVVSMREVIDPRSWILQGMAKAKAQGGTVLAKPVISQSDSDPAVILLPGNLTSSDANTSQAHASTITHGMSGKECADLCDALAWCSCIEYRKAGGMCQTLAKCSGDANSSNEIIQPSASIGANATFTIVSSTNSSSTNARSTNDSYVNATFADTSSARFGTATKTTIALSANKTTTSPATNNYGFPSLFCFVAMRSVGYEPQLMTWQVGRNGGAQDLGIFACDEFAVYSEAGMVPLGTTAKGKAVVTTPIWKMSGNVGGTMTSSWTNVMTFIQCWNAVAADPRIKYIDWVVKVDPDTVFFPERLRPRLVLYTPEGGASRYVRNCGRGFKLKLYGAIEVLSANALYYYVHQRDRCMTQAWQGWGEDYFMQYCWDLLGIYHIDDWGILGDGVCGPANCANGNIAAFHAYKGVEPWKQCLIASTR